MASGNGIGDRGARPYRKHKPLPALIVIGVLALGAIIVWINAAVGKGDVDEAVKCDPAASPPPGVTFSTLPHNALDDRAPVPPDKVAVKVLNASSTRGQGGITTTALKELGFTGAGEPANDPAYEGRVAKCRGQIRFGENGVTAARTLSLVVPCAELVQDNRKDASVDLVTGTLFGDIQPARGGPPDPHPARRLVQGPPGRRHERAVRGREGPGHRPDPAGLRPRRRLLTLPTPEHA